MNYLNQFLVKPGSKVRLDACDPGFTDRRVDKKQASILVETLHKRMDDLQFKLYAENQRSLLICLQAPDAGGKDGVIRHVLASLNPQGCRVVGFKEPTSEELGHDFLWRIERQTPKRGEVVIFNRSQYEDVLIVRVHEMVPKSIWSQRYDEINAFEQRLIANNTHILKFFLHISKEEQLRRLAKRLDDPGRHWKISEADYLERERWDDYISAYQDVLIKCNFEHAPWFIIPSDHKWFRNLAISQIITETMDNLGIAMPQATVDLAEIRRKYHQAISAENRSKNVCDK